MVTVTAPPTIQVLAPEVVERIAAGEVIERPVSVVRELLDNALDAGASEVRIEIRGGGLRQIRVADNGHGIAADQVELALRHHATSKLRAAHDLPAIGTLGFRGEALPSIAAVAELTIVSATGSGPAVRVERGPGRESRTYEARTPGTTVTVRHLFAHIPARLKFLGSARAESALITQLVRRYALAHPTVRFNLMLDGHPSLHTSGNGLRATLAEVYGPAAGALAPLGPLRLEGVELNGFVSGRHLTRSTRQHITLLINSRCVQSRALLAAFEDGYRPLLPRGRHPVALLSAKVPRAQVDINVHPSKQEIKLEGEGKLAEALRLTVRELLGRALAEPPEFRYALGAIQEELPRLVAEPEPEWDVITGERLRAMRVVAQVQGSLILVEDERALYLIDQHRAHERAIYELLCRQQAEERAGQMLLEPLHIQLSRAQLARLEPRLPELAALGFTCEWFGGRSFLVRSVPIVPETAALSQVVEDLLDLASSDESDWQHRILTSVACRSATRRGRPLAPTQCQELVDLLAATESPAACPHGSPIILRFDDRFLRRQFDW